MVDRKIGLKKLAEMRQKIAPKESDIGAVVSVDEDAPDAIVIEASPSKPIRDVSSAKIARYHLVISEAARAAALFGWTTNDLVVSNLASPFPTKVSYLFGLNLYGHTAAEITISFDQNGDMKLRFYSPHQNINIVDKPQDFERFVAEVANANAIFRAVVSAYEK